MNNLASTFGNQGRWREAEELFMQVMEISVRVLGKEHPDTLTCMNNLAHTLKHTRSLGEAMELLNSCLKLCIKILGATHPNTRAVVGTFVLWQQEVEASDIESAAAAMAACAD
ncbi:uncharacterized protein HMPREF1541_10883 [Cyphellophora europaea CBS 101466]|uniref:Kinesin light chain n=1 Tax=Cyphellophora europaea (strain CBS 101466) TaxID=1220924 RepID=W2S7J5_CYPE1|nr:uncharacterized protein HMPREF1541_10883 [Cyphellophora europaea CBS 101466]ETN44018.1 hypothetical protein HMPREF1541_10883 [Cyphellophora europaea CBS 101466]